MNGNFRYDRVSNISLLQSLSLGLPNWIQLWKTVNSHGCECLGEGGSLFYLFMAYWSLFLNV